MNKRQKILRRVRRETPVALGRFKKVNDDDLGLTYVAHAIRKPHAFVVVEICFDYVDDPSGAVDGLQYIVVKRGIE